MSKFLPFAKGHWVNVDHVLQTGIPDACSIHAKCKYLHFELDVPNAEGQRNGFVEQQYEDEWFALLGRPFGKDLNASGNPVTPRLPLTPLPSHQSTDPGVRVGRFQ